MGNLASSRPAGAHRPVVRHDDDRFAARPQDPFGFGEQPPGLARMFEDRDQEDGVERAIRERQLIAVGAQQQAAFARGARHPRDRDIHLHRLNAGAVEHHAFAAADFEDVGAAKAGDPRQHLGPIHRVEVSDDAGDLRLVAFDFGNVLVELAFGQPMPGGLSHASPARETPPAAAGPRRTRSRARR